MPVVSDRTFHAGADAADVWAALERVADYPTWWPWLRTFDGHRLATGERWTCSIRSPFATTIRCTIEIVAVHAGRSVTARLDGGLVGEATLTIAPAGDTMPGGRADRRVRPSRTCMEPAGSNGAERTRSHRSADAPGTTIRLTSRLDPRTAGLRHLASIAPSIARRGHDRLVTTAFAQFAAALQEPGDQSPSAASTDRPRGDSS